VEIASGRETRGVAWGTQAHQPPAFLLLDPSYTTAYTMTDRQTAYSISIFGSQAGDERQDGTTPSRIQQQLVDFVMDFHLDNVFLYRDQIRENVLVKQYYCDIDIAHLISYDEELAHKLQQDPAEVLPLVCLTTPFINLLLTWISSKQP
jgi:hypothetical protein